MNNPDKRALAHEYGLQVKEDHWGSKELFFRLGDIKVWHTGDEWVVATLHDTTYGETTFCPGLESAFIVAQKRHLDTLIPKSGDQRDWQLGQFHCTVWANEDVWRIELYLTVNKAVILVGLVRLDYASVTVYDLYRYGLEWAKNEYYRLGERVR